MLWTSCIKIIPIFASINVYLRQNDVGFITSNDVLYKQGNKRRK